jgi:uncharacterized protein YajQ (UPF0234 family)
MQDVSVMAWNSSMIAARSTCGAGPRLADGGARPAGPRLADGGALARRRSGPCYHAGTGNRSPARGGVMPSFDVVSRVDMQELDNAVNMVKKEASTRYGSKTHIELDRKEGRVRFLTEDDMKLRALKEMLISKAVKRGIDVKAFDFGQPEKAGGDMLRQEVAVANGIDQDVARKVVKKIKDSRIKVQAAIQGDEVRVTGKNRDDLQGVIRLLKDDEEMAIPLQFVNMRE